MIVYWKFTDSSKQCGFLLLPITNSLSFSPDKLTQHKTVNHSLDTLQPLAFSFLNMCVQARHNNTSGLICIVHALGRELWNDFRPLLFLSISSDNTCIFLLAVHSFAHNIFSFLPTVKPSFSCYKIIFPIFLASSSAFCRIRWPSTWISCSRISVNQSFRADSTWLSLPPRFCLQLKFLFSFAALRITSRFFKSLHRGGCEIFSSIAALHWFIFGNLSQCSVIESFSVTLKS